MRRLLVLLVLCAAASAGSVAAGPAFPPELTRFRASAANPVFTGAGPGHWDERIRERGWILHDADGWRLWYTGYDDKSGAVRKLGLATSPDGLQWTRHPDNPIYEESGIEDVQIVRDGDRYLMFAEGADEEAQLLTSPNGVHWTRLGPLDVRRRDGAPIEPGPYGTPAAFHEAGLWHLFYERRDAGVWHATSADLQVWSNVSDDPVLIPGPTRYDAARIAVNQILKHDGRYYALYHGTDDATKPALWTSDLAVSDDLRTWTKFPGNPLFPASANRSSNLLVPTKAMDGTTLQFRLYTMHAQVEAFLPTTDEPSARPTPAP